MENEDFMLDFDDEQNQKSEGGDISLDSEEEVDNLGKELNEAEEGLSDDNEEAAQIDAPNSNDNDNDSDSEEQDEEVNFDELFSELNDANDAIDKIESNDSSDNTQEISVLKQALNNMEQIVKKLTNEKSDLIYKNAELEAFGGDNTDPKILMLSRNLTKAKDGDERSKTKVISTLKDMLYELTGEDFDTSKINKDIDILTAAESYNSMSNPKLKAKNNEDDGFSI